MNYKEKLEEAKRLYKSANDDQKYVIESLFPELKESKDEKIRKKLLSAFKGIMDDADKDELWYGLTYSDILAWLEKQDKQNPCETCEEPRLNCQNFPCERKKNFKPADKVEPKFHEGDWIVHHGTENVYQVVALIDNQYQLKYGDNYTVQKCDDVDRCARLWDITKDAKKGDVLVDVYENIGIYKKCDDFDWMSYCSLGHYGGFHHFNIEHENEKTHPATKEQRDTLMKAMTDAGYTFDFEKKELKKVEQKSTEWSEEDESILQGIWDEILANKHNSKEYEWKAYDKFLDWLKSLKDRVQPKQEWSEEDAKALNRISTILVDASQVKNWWKEYRLIERDEMIRLTDFLKSLKERVQPKQEWSEKDEEKFRDVIRLIEQGATVQSIRDHYINWLKSIKTRIR